MDLQDNAAPAEQGAAQPEATGTTQAPAEQSAPTKSAAEVKLEKELKDAKAKGDGYKRERDTARTQLAKVSEERDTLREQYDALSEQFEESQRQLVARITDTAPEGEASAEAPAKPTQEQEIKALLVRYGLKEAFIMPDGQPCFDRGHAERFMGADFDSLTVISAE
jgi:uncharacterized membrane-anchored protein YhcB (DUF1043 family)